MGEALRSVPEQRDSLGVLLVDPLDRGNLADNTAQSIRDASGIQASQEKCNRHGRLEKITRLERFRSHTKQDFTSLLHLVERNPFIAGVGAGDVAGAEND